MSDVWANRERQDLYQLCEGLIAEKKRLRKLLEDLAIAMDTKPTSEAEECFATVIREGLKIDLSSPSWPSTIPHVREADHG